MSFYHLLLTTYPYRATIESKNYICEMSIEEKAAEIEKVFDELDRAIAEFQSASTLHCKAGCGKCCFKPDIEATALEFIPFALHLHLSGKSDEWYEKLKATDSDVCLILNPTQTGAGLCS